MIPRTLSHPHWLRIAIAIVLAGLLIGAIYGWITARPKAEARLSKNQTEAAVANGADAVGTVASQSAAEAANADLTRSNADEIRKADGAGVPVAGSAHSAGMRALCRRKAYLGRAECVQRPDPGSMASTSASR